MADFEFDVKKLSKALKEAQKAVERGSTTALGDIKDDWVREAVDIAPLDKNSLRTGIHGSIIKPGASGIIEVESNATQSTKVGVKGGFLTGGKRFNYAYYIHEGHMKADGKKLRRPGTVEKYLEESFEKRHEQYMRWLEEDVEAELKKAGW